MSRLTFHSRIALVTATMGAGGTERVVSGLANRWTDEGQEVTLVTIGGDQDDFYLLDPRIRRVALAAQSPSQHPLEGVASNLRRISRLRRAIREASPEVVVSFGDMTNVLVIAATRGVPVKVVVSERNNPFRSALGTGWRVLRRVTYPRADAVVAQTHPVAQWLRSFVPPSRVHTIPNSVAPRDSRADMAARRVVGLGRLEHGKGFDLLMRAFARASASNPGWELMIGGDGPEQPMLERLSRELGLGESARFAGRVTDSGRFMAEASIFAMSSRHEGFPNVLLEAMASGMACVAFDCQFGPSDVIQPGVDGVLVANEDYESMGAALARLMEAPSERARLGAAAREVAGRFAEGRIFRHWDEVARG
jgi:GalNAc-alpha-(1->4)-GalNAc-alpha-(1->3)-diNAcBac-PP-undecaprenol alpha-1,4-N-acetyl-D-galactosaminyltransferase